MTYLCLTDEKNKRRLPFAFLDDIKAKFQAAYAHERIAVAIAFTMNADFSRVMEDRLNYFNDNPNADSFGKVKGQLEEVKGVMVDNIEKVRLAGAVAGRGPRRARRQAAPLLWPAVASFYFILLTRPNFLPCAPQTHQVLARGEKIELLVDKTEALNQSAKKFQKASKSLKNAMWWKNVKMWLSAFCAVAAARARARACEGGPRPLTPNFFASSLPPVTQ